MSKIQTHSIPMPSTVPYAKGQGTNQRKYERKPKAFAVDDGSLFIFKATLTMARFLFCEIFLEAYVSNANSQLYAKKS